MRIAIISDIHGNLAALESVAADIRRRGVDQIVNLGDSVSGPLLPRETAHFLISTGWLSLAGNHERQLLTLGPGKRGPSDEYALSQLAATELAWLRSLEPSARLNDEVFVCHGTPRSDSEYCLETLEGSTVRLATPDEISARLGGERSAVIACGHTHVPRAIRVSESRLVVNPGSVGLPAYDADDPVPHVVETGSTDSRYAIIERRDGAWETLHLSLPYDHKSMAALARKRNRPEWERALLTGYVR